MQYLLAAGEGDVGGLGLRDVKALSVRELNELWYMQRRVLQSHSKEGREQIAQEVTARAAIDVDTEGGWREAPVPREPLDPATATPEQIAAVVARQSPPQWLD